MDSNKVQMKTALVLGGAGFIGHHLAKRLHSEGYKVRVVDLKWPEYGMIEGIQYVIGDLRDTNVVRRFMLDKYQEPFYQSKPFDEVYQLAADMGGAGYVFSGENDAEIMHNSALININVAHWAKEYKVPKLFYSSSACIYPEDKQTDWNNRGLKEDDAYPAKPDSEYGWEKLFSERLYLSYRKNHGLNVKIARFHNIFGEEGTWKGGREKAPAAISRKIAECGQVGSIEVWGDGRQTRSFLYIDECVEGILRLMRSDVVGPINIGSNELISINELVQLISQLAFKTIKIIHIAGPVGVRGRNSDNTLIKELLGWSPSQPLRNGLFKTYYWIQSQIENERK